MRSALVVALALAFAAPATACPSKASPAYTASVLRLVRSDVDPFAGREPSYERLARALHPLRIARARGGALLTKTGVYYLPFGAMLHVGDGSQIIQRRAGGRSVLVYAGPRLFAACGGERLADGWLPILQTRVPGYRQESFAVGGTSYVRLDGAAPRIGALHGSGTLFARWSGGAPQAIPEADYDAARRSLVEAWTTRLAAGTQIVVPDRRVLDAERALLVQTLTMQWRYSVGNPYEEFSFPEGVDVAQVLAEWGFGNDAASIMRVSLSRPPNPYPNWKMGEKLLGWATARRLAGTPVPTAALRAYVARLAAAQQPNGLLAPERYSSDIPDRVYALHGQAVVWQGLNAIAPLVPQARPVAARLRRALLRALPPGDFLPAAIGVDRPFLHVTESRAGSYWNLVMPYALASGLLPESRVRGMARYMQGHGAWLAMLVRAGAYALYGRDARWPTSGTDEVYGINTARFLADLGLAQQLRLALYGHLALGMTPDTFVSGEAASLPPLHGEWYRSMYLPPNAASNSAFLTALRLLFARETGGGLDLAWAVPPRWKSYDVERLPTSWGPVSFSLADGHVSIDLPPRRPRFVHLHLGGRTIDLTGRTGHVEVG